MKSFRRTQSSFSTNICSPTDTPLHSFHMSPLVRKQKLRIKQKQQPKKHQKIKNVRKDKLANGVGEIRHSDVKWIIYNILVGVYRNWLRLAPFIMYYLAAGRRDKINGINKISENVERWKERLLQRMKKSQMIGIQYADRKLQEEQQELYDEMLLQQIGELCNQVKFSTQVFNGEILAMKRVVKTDKQNNLTDKLFQEMKKNQKNANGVKMMLMSDDVSKIAETIVDRIQIVKYMRKNKIKVNDKMLKPLKSIFKNENTLDYEQDMTTDRVIQKIKSQFLIKSNQTLKNSEEGKTNYDKTDHITHQVQQDFNEKLNQQILQFPSFALSEEQANNRHEARLLTGTKSLKSKKKIGFIVEDEELEWWRRIKDTYAADKSRKVNQEIYNQRKVILNRELKRQNVKTMLSNLKNQYESKKNVAHQDEENKKMTSSQVIKNKQKEEKSGKSKKKLGKNTTENEKGSEMTLAKTKRSGNKSRNASLNSYHSQDQSSDEQSSSGVSIQDGKSVTNRHKKMLKPARLLKKRKLKKTSNIFDKIDLQNFDLELKAEQNVVNKKKKILNFFSNLQATGIIKMKSIKKLVTNAKSLEDDIKKMNRTRYVRRYAFNEDLAPTSIFVIPHASQCLESDTKPDDSLPFTFLTAFNKGAVKNWLPINCNNNNRQMRLKELQRARFSGMDCDLNIPIIKKESKKKGEIQWFDKQKFAIDFGLSLIRQMNEDQVKQKALNVQRQYFL